MRSAAPSTGISDRAKATFAVLMGRPRRDFGHVRCHRGSYYIDVRPHGRIWGMGGIGFGDNRPLAEGLLNVIRASVLTGLSHEMAVAPYLQQRSAANKIAARYENWLKVKRAEVEIGDLSPRTLKEYERYAREGGELEWWGERSVFDVTTADLESWALWMGTERKLSPKTRRHVLAALRVCFQWLKRGGVIAHPPDWPTIEVAPYEPMIIEVDVQARILDAIPANERGAHLVCALMGLRPSEVRALMPADYTAPKGGELGQLVVSKAMQGHGPKAEAGPTKNKRNRTLPVPAKVSEWIAEHVADDARMSGLPLFTNPRTKRRWSHWALRQSWLDGCTAAGVGHIRLYDGTKHSFASDALDRTENFEAVRDFLGHLDERSTRLYAKVKRRALVQIARGDDRRPKRDSVGVSSADKDNTGKK